MSYQLDSSVAEKLKLFFSQFDFIDKVVIFGSRAKHNANPKSDIDLCIYSLEMTAKEFTKLKIELDELPILYKIDIVHFENSNDELKKNIVKDGKLFFNRTVQLTNVCELQGGSQPPKSEWNDKKLDGYVRMLQIRDFTQGKDKYIQYVKDAKKLKKCTQTDILIGRYGASIGKILTGLEGAYNVAMMKVTPSEKIDREYLYHFLKGSLFQNAIASIGSRAAQAGFNKEDLSKINIPLPSLTKQKQIAKTLDKAQELIELRKESIKKLDALSKAIFIDMFGDPINNPMGWKVKKLKELSTHILSGNTPKGGSQVYVKKGILFFRSQNVWKNKILLDDIAFIDNETHLKMKKSSLKYKDILITKTGRINTENSSLGRASLFLGKDDSANINGHVYLVRLKKSMVHEFIVYILTTDEYREYIRSVCVGGIDKRQINKIHLEEFPIIFPTLELQKKFSFKIQKIEQQKNLYEEQLTKLRENFDALLAQSFKV